VTLRAAAESDVPAILAIQSRTPNTARFGPADYLQYTCAVALVESEVAGFILVRRVADDEWEILNLAVAPEFHHCGVATALVRMQLDEQKGHAFLEVRSSNSAARNLYKKMGFSEIGVRPQYYSDPSEGAIVMSIRSC